MGQNQPSKHCLVYCTLEDPNVAVGVEHSLEDSHMLLGALDYNRMPSKHFILATVLPNSENTSLLRKSVSCSCWPGRVWIFTGLKMAEPLVHVRHKPLSISL